MNKVINHAGVIKYSNSYKKELNSIMRNKLNEILEIAENLSTDDIIDEDDMYMSLNFLGDNICHMSPDKFRSLSL